MCQTLWHFVNWIGLSLYTLCALGCLNGNIFWVVWGCPSNQKNTIVLVCEAFIAGLPRRWIAIGGMASPLAIFKPSFSSAIKASFGNLYSRIFVLCGEVFTFLFSPGCFQQLLARECWHERERERKKERKKERKRERERERERENKSCSAVRRNLTAERDKTSLWVRCLDGLGLKAMLFQTS